MEDWKFVFVFWFFFFILLLIICFKLQVKLKLNLLNTIKKLVLCDKNAYFYKSPCTSDHSNSFK